MTQGLQFLTSALFAGLMMAAAFDDLRRLVIPNRLTAAVCLLWPAHLATAAEPFWPAAPAAIISAAAVFAGGALFFARGWIGGGDVKLLAATTLWTGAAATPLLLLLTALFGGMLALLVMGPLGAQIAAVRGGPVSSPATRMAVPYGVAIAAAALVVVIAPSFG